MVETTFHYDATRVNHRVVSGVFVATAGLGIALFYPDAPLLVRALLIVAVVIVVFHSLRFQRLRRHEGAALTLSDEGLQVAAWDIGVVPWSEIKGARLVARSNIQIEFQHPQKWQRRRTVVDHMLATLISVFGVGEFMIDGGLLQVRADAILAEIQTRLREHG